MIPKKIYIFWHNLNEIDIFTTKCINKIKELNKDFEICIYDINFYNTISSKYNLKYMDKNSYKSDFIRLYLLSKYGGIWLDASIWCNKSINHIIDLNNNKIQCYNSVILKNKNIETCFIACPKNSLYMKKLFNEYVKASSTGFYEYLLINKKFIQLELINHLPYLVFNVIFYKVFCDSFSEIHFINNNKIEKHVLYYLIKNNWNSKKAILYFKKNYKKYDLCKFRFIERQEMFKIGNNA